MLKLEYKKTNLIDREDFKKEGNRLSPYIEELIKIQTDKNNISNEAVINLPFRDDILKNIRKIVIEKKNS